MSLINNTQFVYKETFASNVTVQALFNDGFEEYEFVSSGFFISADGYIVTTAHTIFDFNTIQDGKFLKSYGVYVGVYRKNKIDTSYKAKYVGADLQMDICVLKLDMKLDHEYFKWGNARNEKIGSNCTNVGYALRRDKLSVVSGTIRNNIWNNNIYGGECVFTTTPVFQGVSGGPLINENNEVIGMLSFVLPKITQASDEMALYASQYLVQPAVDYIIKNKSNYVKGVLGVTTLVPTAYTYALLPGTNRKVLGFLVDQVFTEPGLTYLQSGDLITYIDGKPIGYLEGQSNIGSITWLKRPGDKVEVVLIRGGSQIKLTLKLGSYPFNTASIPLGTVSHKGSKTKEYSKLKKYRKKQYILKHRKKMNDILF